MALPGYPSYANGIHAMNSGLPPAGALQGTMIQSQPNVASKSGQLIPFMVTNLIKVIEQLSATAVALTTLLKLVIQITLTPQARSRRRV